MERSCETLSTGDADPQDEVGLEVSSRHSKHYGKHSVERMDQEQIVKAETHRRATGDGTSRAKSELRLANTFHAEGTLVLKLFSIYLTRQTLAGAVHQGWAGWKLYNFFSVAGKEPLCKMR